MPSNPTPDRATVYPVTCPTWCDGRHAALLCADPDTELDADSVVFHELTLATSANGALAVSLVRDDPHPAADYTPLGTRLAVYLDDHEPTIPDTLTDYAHTLTTARRLAEELLS